MSVASRACTCLCLIATAACSRTDLTSQVHDAGPDGRPVGEVAYKITYLASDPITPLRVWHSRTGSIEKLAWPYSGWFSATYNGRYLVALGQPQPPDDACVVVLLDDHADLLATRTIPSGGVHEQCETISTRDPDASRTAVVVSRQDFDAGASAMSFFVTLDTDGGYRELPWPYGGPFRYAPDGKTLTVIDADGRTIDTVLDDGSNLARLVQGGDPSFSFDQQKLVFLNCTSHLDCRVGVLDLATRAARTIPLPNAGQAAHPQFTPDGQSIVYAQKVTGSDFAYSLKMLSLGTSQVTVILEDMGWAGYGPPPLSVAADSN